MAALFRNLCRGRRIPVDSLLLSGTGFHAQPYPKFPQNLQLCFPFRCGPTHGWDFTVFLAAFRPKSSGFAPPKFVLSTSRFLGLTSKSFWGDFVPCLRRNQKTQLLGTSVKERTQRLSCSQLPISGHIGRDLRVAVPQHSGIAIARASSSFRQLHSLKVSLGCAGRFR